MEPDLCDSSAIARAARDGDRDAIGLLLVRHLPTVRAFVRVQIDAALRARENESDFVQAACLEVLRRADRLEYRTESAFRNWLCGAVLNAVRDRRDHWMAAGRDARREVRTPGAVHDEALGLVYSGATTPERRAISAEEIARIESAIAALPDGQREVLCLHRFVGLTHVAIGERTGRSAEASRQLLRAALTRLALQLTADDSAAG